jgi:hypothetical protein
LELNASVVSCTATHTDYLKTIPATLITRRKVKGYYKSKSSNATMGKSFRYDFYFFKILLNIFYQN